jgi:hypothetical protein
MTPIPTIKQVANSFGRKRETLEDFNNLPDLDVLAQEIVEKS